MPHVMDDERDARLDKAMSLLNRPIRKPSSALIPFAAVVVLVAAGAVLVSLLAASDDKAPSQAVAQPVSPGAAARSSPGFELSGSSLSTTKSDAAPVRDAVIIGTEESR